MAIKKQHVFISYCRDNQKEVARLRKDLMDAGEAVWWDQDILPGEDWKDAVATAMESAYAVILCLSKESEARVTSGIYPEASEAIEAYREYAPGSIFLIPVRLSDCTVPAIRIDGMRRLNDLHHVNLFPEAGRADGLQKLIKGIRATPFHPQPARRN